MERVSVEKAPFPSARIVESRCSPLFHVRIAVTFLHQIRWRRLESRDQVLDLLAGLGLERDLHMGFVQSVAGVPFTMTALVSFEVVSVGLFVLIVKGVIAPYVPKWAYAVGALTYPLYLTHDVMGHAILRELGGRINRWMLLGICVTAFIVLSWAIYRFVERPLSPIIRKSLSHRPPGKARQVLRNWPCITMSCITVTWRMHPISHSSVWTRRQ